MGAPCRYDPTPPTVIVLNASARTRTEGTKKLDMDTNMDMDEGFTLPGWLTQVAWLYLAVSLASAAMIAYQIYGHGHRSRSHAMDIAWIVGALYLGPLALFMFQRAGWPATVRASRTAAQRGDLVRATLRGSLLGGAASAIAHVLGVPTVVLTGLTIAGLDLWAMVAVITVLAIALLFVFESAVRNRQAAAPGPAVTLIAAVVTIVFFDVGMLGWMLLLHFNGIMPAVTDVTFVFLMQVGLVLGFIAGAPAISLLLRRGFKAAV